MKFIKYCPICCKRATIEQSGTMWYWEHNCYNGVEIASNTEWQHKDGAIQDWNNYVSLITGYMRGSVERGRNKL